MSLRRPKMADPLPTIRNLVANGEFDFVSHALARLQQRQVTVPEVVYVLEHGFHERRKDQFKEEYGEWVYAIRGKTLDARKLRVAVAVNIAGALVITVIDLDK